jgi:hypothetical protein
MRVAKRRLTVIGGALAASALVLSSGTTSAWADIPRVTLGTAQDDFTATQVVRTTAGSTVAVWEHDGALTAKRRPAGGSWSAAVTVARVTACCGVLDLKAGVGGGVVLAWTSGLAHLGQGIEVKVATMSATGHWSTRETLPDSGNGASVVVAPDGTLHVAYFAKSSGSETHVDVATSTDGTTWSTEEVPGADHILDNSFIYASPSLGVSPNGTLTVSWNDEPAGEEVSQKAPGQDWSVPAQLGDSNRHVTETLPIRDIVATGPDGTVAVAWDSHPDSRQGHQRIRVAVQRPGGTWFTQDLTPPTHSSYLSGLAVGPGGLTTVVWDQLLNNRGRIMVATHRNQHPWTTPRALSPQGRTPNPDYTGGALAIDAKNGRRLVLYTIIGLTKARDDSTTTTMATWSRGDSGWTKPRRIAHGPGDTSLLEDVDLSTTGPATALWMKLGATHGDSFFVRAGNINHP